MKLKAQAQGIPYTRYVRLLVEKTTTARPRLVSNEGNYLFSVESLQADHITGQYLPLALLLLCVAADVAAWLLFARRRFAPVPALAGYSWLALPLLALPAPPPLVVLPTPSRRARGCAGARRASARWDSALTGLWSANLRSTMRSMPSASARRAGG